MFKQQTNLHKWWILFKWSSPWRWRLSCCRFSSDQNRPARQLQDEDKNHPSSSAHSVMSSVSLCPPSLPYSPSLSLFASLSPFLTVLSRLRILFVLPASLRRPRSRRYFLSQSLAMVRNTIIGRGDGQRDSGRRGVVKKRLCCEVDINLSCGSF